MTTVTSESVLTNHQERVFGPIAITYDDRPAMITATVRYDDKCQNGHNTFSVTGAILSPRGKHLAEGMLHDEILAHFPDLAPYLRWHLVSSDGPMHYVGNTLYWLGYQGFCDGGPNDPPNLAHARSTAVWPDMPDLRPTPERGAGEVVSMLMTRLPQLLGDFRVAVESLGFTW